MKVTAIFDIGKTNKKFFLFDENYRVVFKEYRHFEEVEDGDGFPADDLPGIKRWIFDLLSEVVEKREFDVQALNFSTYGASFIHLDEQGQPVTPLYNYLKPYPNDILQSFYKKYGGEGAIATGTASPPSGMLNSGLQLYWLKYAKPRLFGKIRWSLHFPQYLSYLFTGTPASDCTSIGCHTSLWDYEKNDYHRWVYEEGIDRILPPILPTITKSTVDFQDKKISVGTGIHDSSAALFPYIFASPAPFLLISTGTWSISLNPFSEEKLTEDDLKSGCLNYMRIDGKPVRASRLFLGNEHEQQVRKLCAHFGKEYGFHQKVEFDEKIYRHLKKDGAQLFLEGTSQLNQFPNFETAYHQLMMELAALQIISAKQAIGNTSIEKVYIDGGFAVNGLFVKLLTIYLKEYQLRTTQSPFGSALGAAMVVSGKKTGGQFLKEHFSMKERL